MPMTVLITLTVAGTDTGPFDLYSDVDGYSSAFETGVSKAALLAGYSSALVPIGTTVIRVKSNGICINYIDLPLTTTTTTTTSTSSTTTTTTTAYAGNIFIINNTTTYSELTENTMPAWYLLSGGCTFPILNGNSCSGIQGGFSGTLSFNVVVSGVSNIVIIVNGSPVNCIEVPASGAYTSGVVNILAGDTVSIILSDGSCV